MSAFDSVVKKISSIVGITSKGQATKANSFPVVISSDDDSLARLGAVTETAPGTDTASSGLNGRLQRIAQRLTSLIALLPTSLGQKTKANSLAVTIASDDNTLQTLVIIGGDTGNMVSSLSTIDTDTGNIATVSGAVSDAAVTTDTTGTLSGKLRGLVKWAYERMPASLGQKSKANSFPVTLASDQGAVPVAIAANKITVTKKSGATIAASASTYTSGDVFGGLITLSDVLDSTTFFGRIKKITIQALESTTVDEIDVIIFDSNPSTSTLNDSQGIDIADADDEKVIAVVQFAATDFAPSAGNNKYATKELDLLVQGAADDLFLALTSGGTWTFGSANGIGLVISIEKAA
ncbi:MAG: hypothetical protein H6658_02045 [Ardenticatenaceae bacterium]|nr:hypothetical protein [Ardenticatenaceae bacterium]